MSCFESQKAIQSPIAVSPHPRDARYFLGDPYQRGESHR
jgi:hypothetical protein